MEPELRSRRKPTLVLRRGPSLLPVSLWLALNRYCRRTIRDDVRANVAGRFLNRRFLNQGWRLSIKVNAPPAEPECQDIYKNRLDELLRQGLFQKNEVMLAYHLPKALLLFEKAPLLLGRQTLIKRGPVRLGGASQLIDYATRYFVASSVRAQELVKDKAGQTQQCR